MPKMTPEQEARYALDFGIARSDLPEAAQLVYDRLAEQRARAASQVSISGGRAEAASARVIMPKWVAAAGTALFALITQGAGVVLLPYAFTRWQPGPAWPLAVRALGVALIAAGGIVVIWGFTRFATEGTGIPVPGEPTSRRLTVGGPYRYVRNPSTLRSSPPSPGRHCCSAGQCCWSTPPRSWPPPSRSPTGSKTPRWPGVSARSSRPTASRCPAGGRACQAGGPEGQRLRETKSPPEKKDRPVRRTLPTDK